MERSIQKRVQRAFDVFKHASREYGRDNTSRMAAAVSYRTVFALAPLLVVAVSIAGLVIGGDGDAQAAFVRAVTELAGRAVAEVMDQLLESALEAANTAAVVGVVLLLWSSSTLFLDLQRALNDIFDIPLADEKRIVVLVVQRGVGVLWTVGIGVLLIGVFTVNAGVQIAGEAISSLLNTTAPVVSILGSVLSVAFMALIFVLVFQTLTFRKIPWRAAWVGAGFTSAAFTLAGLVTGVYFRQFGAPTALGISSSIVVLVFLAYLLSSIFLFGAQVSRSYWISILDRDQSHLLFSDWSDGDETERRARGISATALATFVIGMVIGRRSRN